MTRVITRVSKITLDDSNVLSIAGEGVLNLPSNSNTSGKFIRQSATELTFPTTVDTRPADTLVVTGDVYKEWLAVGRTIFIYSDSTPSIWAVGTVSEYAHPNLTIEFSNWAGDDAAYSDWNIGSNIDFGSLFYNSATGRLDLAVSVNSSELTDFRTKNNQPAGFVSLSLLSGEGTFVKRSGDTITGNLEMQPETVMLLDNGNNNLPGLAFNGDQDSGLFRIGPNNIGLTLGGQTIVDYDIQRISLDTVIHNIDGISSDPAYSFISNPGTGLFISGLNSLGVSVDSTEIASFTETGLIPEANMNLGSITNPWYAYVSTVNIGDGAELSLLDPTTLSLSVATTPVIEVSSATTTIKNDLVVSGDLNVEGDATIIQTTNLNITDNMILVNSGETGDGVSLITAGIEVERGTLNNVRWVWNETDLAWGPEEELRLSNIDEILTTDLAITGTGSLRLPNGLDAERPTVSESGMLRWNTTTNHLEYFDSVAWQKFNIISDIDKDTYVRVDSDIDNDDDTIDLVVGNENAITVTKNGDVTTTTVNGTLTVEGANSASLFEDAVLDFDFTAGRYMMGGEVKQFYNIDSFSKDSVKYFADDTENYNFYGFGQLARNGVGALLEGASTNKCENFNANPTDLTGVVAVGGNVVVSVVDDSAALAAAGLSNICSSGMVFKLDNTAGATEQGANVSGATGNTNAHSFQAYVRSEGGVQASILDNFGQGRVSTTSATYTQLTRENYTPGGVDRTFGARVAAGGVAYFILNQLEEASFASSPIITAGSAATRADDSLIIPTADFGLSAGEGAVFWKGKVLIGATGSYKDIITLRGADTSDRTTFQVEPDGDLVGLMFSGGVIQTSITKTIPLGADVAFGLTWGGGSVRMRLGSDSALNDATATSPLILNTLGIGNDGATGNPSNALHKRLAIINRRLADAEFDEIFNTISTTPPEVL